MCESHFKSTAATKIEIVSNLLTPPGKSSQLPVRAEVGIETKKALTKAGLIAPQTEKEILAHQSFKKATGSEVFVELEKEAGES